MRRMFTIGIAAALAALVLPAAAMARHSSHHARSHHHRRHHVAHTVVFSSATVRHTTPSPAGSETPTGTEGEAAGTIASFEGGVLKITLSDGTTVSGKVTEQTRIECGCAGHEGVSGGEGGDHGFGGDSSFSGGHGDSQGDDEHGSMPFGTPGSEETPSCGTSALVAGAKVAEAELTVGSSGAVWEKVDLAHS